METALGRLQARSKKEVRKAHTRAKHQPATMVAFPPLLACSGDTLQSFWGRSHALLGFFQLFLFLLLFGVRNYTSVPAAAWTSSSSNATTTTTAAAEQRDETVQDFFDPQKGATPPLSNRSFDEDFIFGKRIPKNISYRFMLEEHPYFHASPFELRYPTMHLSRWAEKRRRTGQKTIPKGKHVCLTHVGKTGGSTLGCSLGFSLHCRRTTMLEGVLPLYTTNIMHNGMSDCPDHMPYFLFPVRNPLHRIKSAYLYDRPKDPYDFTKKKYKQFALYLDCPFWTLEKLATKGLAKDGNATDVCKERAVRTIQGMERHGYHLYYNYRWHVKETQVGEEHSSSQILVIRNEHLVEDWNSLEQLLSDGASNVTVTEFKHANPAPAWKSVSDDAVLSDGAREILCRYLCEEIQVYKWILFQAVNLDENDFIESMKDLRETCPVEAIAKSCAPL